MARFLLNHRKGAMVQVKREPDEFEFRYREIENEIEKGVRYFEAGSVAEHVRRICGIEQEVKPKIEHIDQNRQLVIKLDRDFLKKNFPTKWLELVKSTFRHSVRKKTCQVCKDPIGFTRLSALIEHYKENHAREWSQFNCTLCHFSSKKHQLMLDHWEQKHASTSQSIAKFNITKIANDPDNIWIGDDELVRSMFGRGDPEMRKAYMKELVNCEICSKGVPRYYKQTHRTLFHSNERSFECDYCHKKFSLKTTLISHMATHTEMKFECEFCSKKFALQQSLRNHKYIHLKDTLPDDDPRVKRRKSDLELIECDICLKKIVRKSLHLHKRIHSNALMFKCDICNKSFRRNSSLREHSYTHLDKKPFPCQYSSCSKSFGTRRQLEHHELVHLKGILPDDDLRWNWRDYKKKKVKCEICSKIINQYSLKHHMLIHKNEKPYKCNHCARTFRLKANLRLHEVVHTNKKPFKCAFCGAKYRHKSYLKVHERFHREGLPKCQICSKKFTNFAFVTRHLRTHHFYLLRQQDKLSNGSNSSFQGMQTFECYKCKLSRPFSVVKKHINKCNVYADFFQCKKCIRKFHNRKSLENHMKDH